MKRIFIIASACAAGLALASCGGTGSNPITGGGSGTTSGSVGTGTGAGTGTTTTVVANAIPDQLAGNLSRISYDASAGTLTVEMGSLDTPAAIATYDRAAALDVPGYVAYSVQNDALDRMFVALTAASSDGSVQAAVVADGGQFNTYLSGGYYERTSGNVPSTGLVSYAGTYAGISNQSHPTGSGLIAPPLGTPPELLPDQPRLTEGDIFLNVSFSDNTVNGAIYNHQFVDGEALPSITLVLTDINGTGEFLGTTEFAGRPDVGPNGSYGGVFGGTDASSVAGVVALNTIYLPDDARDTDFDALVGVFVLDQCGPLGSPVVCP